MTEMLNLRMHFFDTYIFVDWSAKVNPVESVWSVMPFGSPN